MTDADRELVELAARAYGLQVKGWIGSKLKYFDPITGFTDCEGIWNPLEDDGDAFRLMARLKIEIEHNHPADNDEWVAASAIGVMIPVVQVYDGELRIAVLRRAITMTAAEIGRGM